MQLLINKRRKKIPTRLPRLVKQMQHVSKEMSKEMRHRIKKVKKVDDSLLRKQQQTTAACVRPSQESEEAQRERWCSRHSEYRWMKICELRPHAAERRLLQEMS